MHLIRRRRSVSLLKMLIRQECLADCAFALAHALLLAGAAIFKIASDDMSQE
jgi:predicted DNA-binding helix-hairpin-helix protein